MGETPAETPPEQQPAAAQPGMTSASPSGLGASSGGMARFSMPAFSGGASGLGLGLAASVSWLSGSMFGGSGPSQGYAAGSSTMGTGQTEQSQSTSEGTAAAGAAPDPGDGAGDKWLYEFLAYKGLRGDKLRVAWAIGMRESGGDPSLVAAGSAGSWTYPNVPGWINWGTSDSPHYDTGVFQINNVHLDKVRSKFGSNVGMEQMVDPNKNFEIANDLSSNWTNLLAWGMNPDGSFDDNSWRMYPDDWQSKYRAQTEQRTAEFFNQYEQINVNGYSEGAYRTHNEMAQLHEGEMVLPAAVAEQFRQIMREAAVPGSRSGDITINLKIDKASDDEAERFARKVQKILKEDDWMSSMRSR